MKRIKWYQAALAAAIILALGNVVVLGQGGRAGVSSSTSVPTNSVKLTSSDLGPTVRGLIIYNASGTETVKCSFASGTTYANSPISINPSATAVFPSSTYEFVPGGGVWARGNTVNVTNTVIVEVIVP